MINYLMNLTDDVLIWFLGWAIVLFVLVLDCLIESIKEDRKNEKKRRGWS